MSDEPQIGMQIPQHIYDQARRYQAYVLLTSGRQITIKDAAAELILKGVAASGMPKDQHASTTKKK